jgi:putative Mn2+ efflux pump MntP
MSYIELLLIGLSLCFDTFAVSLTGGICMRVKPNRWQVIRIFLTFALFQTGFTLIGWVLGTELYSLIEKVDHWIAFGLLVFIGGNMALEGLKPKVEECCQECKKSKTDLLNFRNLCLLSVATSIDALAVGISLAMVSLTSVKIVVGMGSIFLFTALASILGLKGGRSLGDRLGNKPELVGGVILIVIGVKILLEHLVF